MISFTYVEIDILITNIMWQNNKLRWIVGGATTLGVSYLIYRLYNDRHPPEKPNVRKQSYQSQQQQQLRTVHSNYSQFYFDKEQQLRLVISKISPKGPTVEQIYLLSPLIIVDEYLKYTREIRKRRRLIRKVDQEKYVGLICTYEVQVKELLQRGRIQVMQEYGLSNQDLAKMEEAYEMFENLQALKKKALAGLKEKTFQKDKLRIIPKQKLRKIIQQQINFISNKLFERIKIKLQNDNSGITQQDIFIVITTLCDDIIYQKYGYEREEIQNQIGQVPLLAKDLKKQRQILFANIVQFNIDSMQSPDQDGDSLAQSRIKSKKSLKTNVIDSDQIDLKLN